MNIWLECTAPVVAMASTSGLGPGSDPQIWPLLLKMMAALGVVLGLMLLLSAGLRKYRLGREKSGDASIKIKESRALGSKKMLCLVEVRGQDMLLGITAERIMFLSHIPPRQSTASFAQVMDEQNSREI
ncbi:MAG: flagellar biosynthetic protein FliO [Desulfovermiculus sp.]